MAVPKTESALNMQALWKHYEDVAMHFNDLLIRLRLQSLAGTAAVATIVGIFTKGADSKIELDWLIASALLAALTVFWIAIFCLDFLYYNRLLSGAVSAVTALEASSANGAVPSKIDLSTVIEQEFERSAWSRAGHCKGVLWFYALVLLVVSSGAVFSGNMYLNTRESAAGLAASRDKAPEKPLQSSSRNTVRAQR